MRPDELVEAALERARAAWPDIIGDPGSVRQSLLAGVDAEDGAAVAAAIAAVNVGDLFLAKACARGEAAAIAAFDRELLARVPGYLARHAARPHADEIRQVLRARLLVATGDAPPRIAMYAGRGSLASWLRVATVRAAANFVRGEPAAVPVREEDLPASALVELPELRVLAADYRAQFRAAFRLAFAALPVEDRTILRLHFLDGATVRALAPVLGVSSATAGRRLLAAQQRLGQMVLEELSAALDTPVGDLESAVRAIVSRLDVSLSALQV